MLKLKLCVFIVALSAWFTNVSAQIFSNSCTTIYRSLGNTYRDVAYIGSKIIVIGDYGKIVVSDNDGVDWRYVQSATNEHLGDLQMVTANVGYIASTNGILLKTEDGGENWFPLQPGEERTTLFRGYRIYFLSELVGFHYGQGKFFKTVDGGKSWKNIVFELQGGDISDMTFVNETTGFLCGYTGLLARTTDGGVTWQKFSPGGLNQAKLTSVVFVNTTTGFLSDDSGDIMKSTDGGLTWSRVGMVEGGVNRLIFIDEQNAYAIGENTLKRTTDGGLSWNDENSGEDYSSFQNIAYNPGNKRYIGVGSWIMKLKNDTGPWVRKSNLGFITLHDRVFFPDDMTGYLLKSSSENFKTIDGGITWEKMIFSEDYHERTTAVHFFNKDVGIYTSEYNIFRTTDGAKTWAKPSISGYSGATAMTFANDKVGYLATDKRIYQTLDAGLTWQSTYSLPSGLHVSKLQFPSVNVGYSLYEDLQNIPGNKVYKTTDQGVTWKAIAVADELFLKSIYFFDEQNGFVGGYSGALYKTENGGESWLKIDFEGFSVSNISFHDRQHGFINSEHKIFETKDGGQTWTYATNTRWDAVHWNTVNGETYILDKDGEITKIPRTGSPALTSGYISGSNVVPANTTHTYKGVQTPGVTYNWSVNGSATIVTGNSEAYVKFTEPGEYLLKATPSNSCGVGAGRTLTIMVNPAIATDNFEVSIYSATCKGSKNGSLQIKTLQKLNYRVTIKGTAGSIEKTYNFDKELIIPELGAGGYDLSFSIQGNDSFVRNQRVVIDEPKDLSVYSSLKTEEGLLRLDLAGSDEYYIDLNGKQYKTSNSIFDLKLTTGNNKVRVYTKQICQGVFEKDIVLSGVEIYPNPVVSQLKINPGLSEAKEIGVEIRNIVGVLLLTKNYANNGDPVAIDLDNFITGTYILTLKLDRITSTHKIIKQ